MDQLRAAYERVKPGLFPILRELFDLYGDSFAGLEPRQLQELTECIEAWPNGISMELVVSTLHSASARAAIADKLAADDKNFVEWEERNRPQASESANILQVNRDHSPERN
jgi:hypothetical protein